MSSANDFSQAAFPPFVNQLLQSGYLTLPQVQQALIEKRQSGRSLTEIIESITGHSLPPDILKQYRQEQLFRLKILHGLDVVDPETKPIAWSQIEPLFKSIIPLEFCRRHQILPLARQDGASMVITLAMVSPDHNQTLDDLRRILKISDIQFERKVITQQDYNQLLEQYEKYIPPARQLKEQELETMVNLTEVSARTRSTSDMPKQAPTASKQPKPEFIVTLVDKILAKAVEYQASEIHLEPQAETLIVYFRQSGILRNACEPLSQKIADAVVSRFKGLANLAITPPQKGKLQRTLLGRSVNFSLNTLPSQFGEKLILRVSDPHSSLPALEKLIVLEPTRKIIKHLLNRPAGLLVLTGSDRCGKSTTFYSLLNERNRQGINISTVEDPIERTINGITQIEIDPEQGRDCRTVLQLFLNQEADIIGIDQIRDAQTAKTAIEAAMTGHLVITTIPGDCPENAIAHFRQMGISPTLLTESLIGIINQRLLRRLCPSCRLSRILSADEITQLNLSPQMRQMPTLYQANCSREKRCPQCQGAGYIGSVAVYEVFLMTSRLKTLIAQGVDAKTLRQAANQDGMKSMLSYAQELVLRGETTLEEVERALPQNLAEPGSPTTYPQKIAERLQEVEKLLTLTCREFELLKQEFQTQAASSEFEPPDSPHTVYEELQDARHWETLVKDLVGDRETMICDTYEELTDPGDWEKLREDLEPDPEMLVSEISDDDRPPDGTVKPSPTRAVPDPWT